VATAQDQFVSGGVRAGAEFDTNANRLEGDDADADGLARYFATLALQARAGQRGALSLDVNHGGKFFVEQVEADTLLTQITLGYRHRLGGGFGAWTNFDIRDRTERVSLRDYNRGGLAGGLEATFGDVFGRVGAGWRYFAYKPSPEFSSSNIEGTMNAGWRFHPRWMATVGYTLAQRDFDTPRLIVDPEDDVGIVETDTEREDLFHFAQVGAEYRGVVIAQAQYALAINRSNSFGQALTRHALEFTLTAGLFWELLASAQLGLQRTSYADPVLIDASFIIDEDNRNALIASLARPFLDNWEVEVRYALYLQEFGVGSDYSRQTVMLAVGYLFDG
jgi:hypothetical protein